MAGAAATATTTGGGAVDSPRQRYKVDGGGGRGFKRTADGLMITILLLPLMDRAAA